MDCLSSRSNDNASYISSTSCTCSVTLRSPPLLVLDDVALPIIDELANEFFRLFKQVNNSVEDGGSASVVLSGNEMCFTK